MSWTLSCNYKTFTNKLSAIREQVASSQGLYFHTPKVYNNYDFTIEPKLSLEELCKQKALQLREENDKIVIWYSGGCDSHYVLNTFLQNKIPVDEIVMVKSGFSKADFEITASETFKEFLKNDFQLQQISWGKNVSGYLNPMTIRPISK